MRYIVSGNQKFYDYFKPMIDTLVKTEVIEWTLDSFVDGEKGTGYIWDRSFCFDFNKSKIEYDKGMKFGMPYFMRTMLEQMRDNPPKIPWSVS